MKKLTDEQLAKMSAEEIHAVWLRVLARKDADKYQLYAEYLRDWAEQNEAQ